MPRRSEGLSAAHQTTLGWSSTLLAVCLVCSWLAGSQAGPLYTVCLVQNPGFANCTVDGDQSKFTGIDVDLISLIATSVGWKQVANPQVDVSDLTMPAYTFVCTAVRVTPIINILTNMSSSSFDQCAMGAGAFTATSARVQLGVRFSWPHLHSSLGVMVASDQQKTTYDKWAFLRPFSPQIWGVVIASTIGTPILLSLFENLIQTGRVPVGLSLLNEWRHASYTMFLCCFNLTVLEVLSAPCQLIIICFAFTNLILVASYTANLAAVLTAAATVSGIQSLGDLVGKTVAAHPVYVDRLLVNKHIKATPLTWGGEPFFLQVKDMLVSGTLDAYIFDKPLLQYYMGQDDPNCQLFLLNDNTVEPFDYGVAFHRLMPEDSVRNFSLGVLQAQSAGSLTMLSERYLSSSSVSCSSTPYDTALQFAQISGLYIILGAAAGLGLLCSIYAIWYHHFHKPSRLKAAAIKRQASGRNRNGDASFHGPDTGLANSSVDLAVKPGADSGLNRAGGFLVQADGLVRAVDEDEAGDGCGWDQDGGIPGGGGVGLALASGMVGAYAYGNGGAHGGAYAAGDGGANGGPYAAGDGGAYGGASAAGDGGAHGGAYAAGDGGGVHGEPHLEGAELSLRRQWSSQLLDNDAEQHAALAAAAAAAAATAGEYGAQPLAVAGNGDAGGAPWLSPPVSGASGTGTGTGGMGARQASLGLVGAGRQGWLGAAAALGQRQASTNGGVPITGTLGARQASLGVVGAAAMGLGGQQQSLQVSAPRVGSDSMAVMSDSVAVGAVGNVVGGAGGHRRNSLGGANDARLGQLDSLVRWQAEQFGVFEDDLNVESTGRPSGGRQLSARAAPAGAGAAAGVGGGSGERPSRVSPVSAFSVVSRAAMAAKRFAGKVFVVEGKSWEDEHHGEAEPGHPGGGTPQVSAFARAANASQGRSSNMAAPLVSVSGVANTFISKRSGRRSSGMVSIVGTASSSAIPFPLMPPSAQQQQQYAVDNASVHSNSSQHGGNHYHGPVAPMQGTMMVFRHPNGEVELLPAASHHMAHAPSYDNLMAFRHPNGEVEFLPAASQHSYDNLGSGRFASSSAQPAVGSRQSFGSLGQVATVVAGSAGAGVWQRGQSGSLSQVAGGAAGAQGRAGGQRISFGAIAQVARVAASGGWPHRGGAGAGAGGVPIRPDQQVAGAGAVYRTQSDLQSAYAQNPVAQGGVGAGAASGGVATGAVWPGSAGAAGSGGMAAVMAAAGWGAGGTAGEVASARSADGAGGGAAMQRRQQLMMQATRDHTSLPRAGSAATAGFAALAGVPITPNSAEPFPQHVDQPAPTSQPGLPAGADVSSSGMIRGMHHAPQGGLSFHSPLSQQPGGLDALHHGAPPVHGVDGSSTGWPGPQQGPSSFHSPDGAGPGRTPPRSRSSFQGPLSTTPETGHTGGGPVMGADGLGRARSIGREGGGGVGGHWAAVAAAGVLPPAPGRRRSGGEGGGGPPSAVSRQGSIRRQLPAVGEGQDSPVAGSRDQTASVEITLAPASPQ